jgi:hypothetical protein
MGENQWMKKKLERFFEWAERKGVPWYKLPKWFSILDLYTIRTRLRRDNLHQPPTSHKKIPSSSPLEKCGRSLDGSYTDLQKPLMGSAGTCFGRNMQACPIAENDPQLMTPNPREISQKLLARTTFIPATSLNLLAAAWIQFQVHGWFRHNHDYSTWLSIPVAPDDDWPYERPIIVPATQKAQAGSSSADPPAYINDLSHWWDGSQIYGYRETAKILRSFENGKLIVTPEGLLPIDPEDGIDITGMRDNWWVGLSLIHTLFTLEHNAICDRLKVEYPGWSDKDLYRTARLINAAVMAKIHTVEWTVGILNHPVIKLAMNINWMGLRKQGYDFFSTIFHDKELADGILGSPTQYAGVDYHLTEEFVSVYRLHPLIPDEISFYSIQDQSALGTFSMIDMAGPNARAKIQNHISMTDLFYSFGITHPGAISLHNYPTFLRTLTPQRLNPGDPDTEPIDLAAVEILRDRERGVPRYNAFRKAVHMPPIHSFEELSDDPATVKELKELYKDIDSIDLLVGLFAEKKPPGFGFSDTAFRIFVLLASRRIECDRFFTKDYNEKTYTSIGLEWIEKTSMSTVLLRHYPHLLPALRNVDNAFAPWESVDNMTS